MTIIVETWNAYEEMKLDFGGGIFASFDDDHHLIQAPLRDRLCWCLHDVKQTIESDEYKDLYWILKSSVTNKGYDISIIKTWDELLQSLEASSHIREWVLQRYIERPLLID
jgi:ABC-type glycerol-3-phosphate transport system substrate-binding protein